MTSTLYDPAISQDQSWRIDTARADGGIVANAVEEDMPEVQRGETLTLTFKFWDDTGMTGQSGLTFDSAQTGGTFGGQGTGGTFGVADAQATHMDRYRAAREYLDYAGAATTHRARNGTVHYTESLPNDAPVDSLVIPVEPGDGLEATPGFWGIVMGGDDSTRFIRDMAVLQLEFEIIAERDEYLTRADIEAARGSSVIG